MALMRHCDFCDELIGNDVYISVKFTLEDSPSLVAGLPQAIEGDFCCFECLRLKVIEVHQRS